MYSAYGSKKQLREQYNDVKTHRIFLNYIKGKTLEKSVSKKIISLPSRVDITSNGVISLVLLFQMIESTTMPTTEVYEKFKKKFEEKGIKKQSFS